MALYEHRGGGTTFISRNAFVFKLRGFTPPPDVACYVNGEPVTWAEVMEIRRERQRRILEWKRRDFAGRWRPVRVTVRYFDQWLKGGWHTYFDAAGGYSHWVRKDRYERALMEMFPVRNPRSPLFPVANFYEWMEAFARTYTKGQFCRRPRGCRIIWARMTGRGHWADVEELAPVRPAVS